VIKELVVGKSYTMIETKPADGYVTAESIDFTIENTAEIQKHEMLDDVTKVEISKTDITGKKELPGAKLTILDSEGNVVESWVSTEEAHYIEKLPIGTYTLREEQAPDGYLVAEDITFEVEDTAEIQKVVMKDEAIPTSVPQTGDDTNLWLPVLLMVLSAAGFTGLFVNRKRKKRKKD
jgi:LPXTG-motif cell wall-anchored protein